VYYVMCGLLYGEWTVLYMYMLSMNATLPCTVVDDVFRMFRAEVGKFVT
jgi:hypothetical protein